MLPLTKEKAPLNGSSDGAQINIASLFYTERTVLSNEFSL